LLTVDASVPADPDVEKIIAPYREKVSELAAEQCGLVGREREACEPRQPVDVSG